MATTKLRHIKGRLRDLIEYVENPAKTADPSMQDFFNVFSYTQNPDKTDCGEFVTAINCVKEIALEQMILTKKQFCKDDGYIAWHGYQSFKPGEVTPEECHAIGVQTARELWGDHFQIIVTTHLDREHLHNHFGSNSVGFRDGRKYNYSKAERRRMMESPTGSAPSTVSRSSETRRNPPAARCGWTNNPGSQPGTTSTGRTFWTAPEAAGQLRSWKPT